MKNKKIFVVSQPEIVNTIGGAITAFNDFCNFLADKGYDVYTMCYTDLEGSPKGLNDGITFFNLKKIYGNDYSFKSAINKLVGDQRPNLIVFFFSYLYVNADLEECFDNIPRLLMFHSRPDWYLADEKELNILKKQYKNTTAHILLPSFYRLLPKFIQENNVVCVPNPLKTPNHIVDREVEKKRIVYLSRIDVYKGFELLINSWALIANKYPDWEVHIWGQSTPPDYINKLKSLTKKLKIDNSFIFKGVTKKPLETFLNYDFCVFPSMFEGFGLGLAEALSVGLPAIGLKQCSAVNELIVDSRNGFLSDFSPKSYAYCIERLIVDKHLRIEMGKNAVESVKCFEKNKVFEKWDNVINKLLLNDNTMYEVITSTNCEYELFTLDKIGADYSYRNLNLWQKLFSVKFYKKGDKKMVQLSFLGFKLRMKRK